MKLTRRDFVKSNAIAAAASAKIRGASADLADLREIERTLNGDSEAYKRLGARLGEFVVDATDVVEMQDPPLSVLRGKRNSSLSVCAGLVRSGRAPQHR